MTPRDAHPPHALEEGEHQAFLLRLSDALAPLADPELIEASACRMLGEWLDADRGYYLEVDGGAGVARVRRDFVRGSLSSLAGEHRLASFGWSVELLQRGERYAVSDTQTSALVPAAERPASVVLGVIAAMGTPLLEDGALVGALCVTASRERTWTPAEIELLEQVGERVWAAVQNARAEAALRESEAHFRALIECFGQAVWEMTPEGRIVRDSPSWRAFTGQSVDEWLEQGWLGALHPDDRAETERAWAAAIVSRSLMNVELRLRHGGAYRWVNLRIAPLIEDDGQLSKWVGMTIDIHHRKESDRHRKMLMAELDHRVKNTLSVVQAMAEMSLASAPTESRKDFLGRLSALATAHRLLAKGHWLGVSLEHLLLHTLKPHGQERITTVGPMVELSPKAAQTLGMAMHELATNAIKHGALSVPSGRVAIEWTTEQADSDENLVIRWHEEGGPELEGPPERRGGGSRLMEEMIPYELAGEVSFDYQPGGLVARIQVPFAHCSRIELPAPSSSEELAPFARDAPPPPSLRDARILVVEDEGLVARALSRALRRAGSIVVGPTPTLEEAQRLAAEPLDAALLDINVSGEMIWPLAETLREKGVPLVFTTGYADDGELAPEFDDVPWVTKPYEVPRALMLLAAQLPPRTDDDD